MELTDALRQITLQSKTPIILKNVDLKWPIFKQTLREWCELFDKNLNNKVEFDIGAMEHYNCPYWERFRSTESMTLVEFLDSAYSGALTEKWATYSYQDIDSWPHEIRKDINFKSFGFENVENILFWIGSKGANTPCHYDTYGINIVVQVFGRKRWLLFPPGCPMNITRVPYEESSVYCKQNFYSPADVSQFTEISKCCHEIILEPTDILIVPPHWWHYVENLDETLTINSWIPMEELDARARLEECLVKQYITQITRPLDEGMQRLLLNPNEFSDMDTPMPFPQIARAIGKLLLGIRSKRSKRTKSTTENTLNSSMEIQDVLDKHLIQIFSVEKMLDGKFKELMLENRNRLIDFSPDHDLTYSDEYRDTELLINSMCHPDSIHTSCSIYLNALERELQLNE